MKILLIVLVTALLLIGGFFALNSYIYEEKQATATTDYKDAEFFLEGQRVKLSGGVSETEAAPGSASKITTRYFGNELKTDLNGDGREDVAFILTQNSGGSGTFFYAVAALNTERGYVGSDGYLLGDRIAPQSTELSPNPRHENVVVFNYADRAEGEPMTAQPAVGKSTYLKLDPDSMQWGIVEPDFEGEADTALETDYTERYTARVDRVDVVFEQKDYTQYRLTTNGLVREGELNTERGFGDDPDATVYVLNWQKPEGEQITYVRLTNDPTHLYILDGNREIVKGSALVLEE